MLHCQQTLISRDPKRGSAMTKIPVPWSLAWCEDGELAPQDRFDLLQTLISSENLEVQSALIASIESLPLADLTVVSTTAVTGIYS
jgi:hypothetical protein